jgi:hypothetical protein
MKTLTVEEATSGLGRLVEWALSCRYTTTTANESKKKRGVSGQHAVVSFHPQPPPDTVQGPRDLIG